MPELLYSSIFGELTRNVQIRFDAVSELNKRLFDNVISSSTSIGIRLLSD